MVELNEQQLQALDQQESPLCVVDPRTQVAYALIPLEAYERLRSLLSVESICATAELVDRVMAHDDANDPHLEEYQRLYGKKS